MVAGTNLQRGWSTLPAALFNVDRGDTNTFMVFFVDQNGNPWVSNGVENT